MSAIISRCGRYRYFLRRDLNASLTNVGRTALWVMLNPSTADATDDDPTIRRCIGFTRAFDCDRLLVVNLYALRATDPRQLWEVDDPVGPRNDTHIREAASAASLTICAWGAGAKPDRVAQVLPLLRDPRCLGTTADGSPRHPLYLPKTAQLERLEVAA